MKKFNLILLILVITGILANAQGNVILPLSDDPIADNGLFAGVAGTELSTSEMKERHGEIAPVVIIAGAITAYGAGCIIYKFATGRDYTSDIHKKAIRLYKKTKKFTKEPMKLYCRYNRYRSKRYGYR